MFNITLHTHAHSHWYVVHGVSLERQNPAPPGAVSKTKPAPTLKELSLLSRAFIHIRLLTATTVLIDYYWKAFRSNHLHGSNEC